MYTPSSGHPTALLASYVLEALEPTEQHAIEQHLHQCAACRLAAHALATELFAPDGPQPRAWVKWLLYQRIDTNNPERQ